MDVLLIYNLGQDDVADSDPPAMAMMAAIPWQKK